MRRVVISGMGIVSSLGNNQQEVLDSLQTQKSGISYSESFAEVGLRSHVCGSISFDIESVDKKLRRFMGDAACYSYAAMEEAIRQAGLTEAMVSHEKTGLIMGAGGASTANVVEAVDLLREKGIKRVGPYRVTRTMNSSINACLATPYKIRGINYSVTSACATSAHCISTAVEQIQWGNQDIVFAGGGDDVHWSLAVLFDGMGALSTQYNDQPYRASRAYDQDRDGFVISGGAGVVVVEALDHALARGANILAEVTGFGATSDGADMVQPSGEGAIRCMKQAVSMAKRPIDYINAHGTSTKIGDVIELGAINEAFDGQPPIISSTKSLSGHGLGAAGVHEAIYSILMLQNQFAVGSANIESFDEKASGHPIIRENESRQLRSILSNSFGFGGTNGCLVLSQYED